MRSFTEQAAPSFRLKRIQNAGTEVVEAKSRRRSATLSGGPAPRVSVFPSGSRLVVPEKGVGGMRLYVEGDGQYARFFSAAAAG